LKIRDVGIQEFRGLWGSGVQEIEGPFGGEEPRRTGSAQTWTLTPNLAEEPLGTGTWSFGSLLLDAVFEEIYCIVKYCFTY
jgi:hypothetical protein